MSIYILIRKKDLGGWGHEEGLVGNKEGELYSEYIAWKKLIFIKKGHDFNMWHSLLICFKSSKVYFQDKN